MWFLSGAWATSPVQLFKTDIKLNYSCKKEVEYTLKIQYEIVESKARSHLSIILLTEERKPLSPVLISPGLQKLLPNYKSEIWPLAIAILHKSINRIHFLLENYLIANLISKSKKFFSLLFWKPPNLTSILPWKNTD